MTKNKKKVRTRVEYLLRTVQVESFNAYLTARIDDDRGLNPTRNGSAWLEFRGVLDEPVKGQAAIRISVHEAEDDNLGTKRPAVIGFVFGTKPDVHVVVTLPPKAFERTWSMALTGRVTNVWLSMTPPRYGNADVPSISFSNEPIE